MMAAVARPATHQKLTPNAPLSAAIAGAPRSRAASARLVAPGTRLLIACHLSQ
jgi:hypothetical protein